MDGMGYISPIFFKAQMVFGYGITCIIFVVLG